MSLYSSAKKYPCSKFVLTQTHLTCVFNWRQQVCSCTMSLLIWHLRGWGHFLINGSWLHLVPFYWSTLIVCTGSSQHRWILKKKKEIWNKAWVSWISIWNAAPIHESQIWPWIYDLRMDNSPHSAAYSYIHLQFIHLCWVACIFCFLFLVRLNVKPFLNSLYIVHWS